MKNKFIVFSLMVVILSPFVFSKSEDEVIECFEKYKTAVTGNKGEEAVQYVDTKTVDFYQDILDSILYADKETIIKESLANKFMILLIRSSVPLESLKEMDGKSLLALLINKGLAGADLVIDNSIKNVTLDENFATADCWKNDKDTGQKHHFYYEDQQWKLNFTPMIEWSNTNMKQYAEYSGYDDEEEFALYMIKNMTGREVSEDIFKPLLKKE